MKLSIITINRNNAEGLRKTMESVLSQTYRDFEYIIVDGASTDESVEVIQGLAPEKDLDVDGIQVHWLSEPDSGIYNAMNKGVRLSTGEYSLMLNSGDLLMDGHVIEKVMPELDGTDIVQGNIIVRKNGKFIVNRGYGKSDLTFFDVCGGHFLHQASFIHRSVFEMLSGYDETYRMIADTKMYIQALGFHNCTFKYVNINVADFDLGGVTFTQRALGEKERARLEQDLFSERLLSLSKDGEKKVRLYDLLHSSRFLWNGTMLLLHVYKFFHRDACNGSPKLLLHDK